MQIATNESTIKAQLIEEFEHNSMAIFSHIITNNANDKAITNTLKAAWLDTKLGPMLAIADDHELCLLEFAGRKRLKRQIEQLCQRTTARVTVGRCDPIESIEAELTDYFSGKLNSFKTPFRMFGSQFQQAVWQALLHVPYGQTRSYKQQAEILGKPSAFRAVANANGANPLAIIIPCHRIINTNGNLGGYGGGLPIKKWLLEHERSYS